jgi:hypothetical protein
VATFSTFTRDELSHQQVMRTILSCRMVGLPRKPRRVINRISASPRSRCKRGRTTPRTHWKRGLVRPRRISFGDGHLLPPVLPHCFPSLCYHSNEHLWHSNKVQPRPGALSIRRVPFVAFWQNASEIRLGFCPSTSPDQTTKTTPHETNKSIVRYLSCHSVVYHWSPERDTAFLCHNALSLSARDARLPKQGHVS